MTYLSEVIADSPIHYWRAADPGGALMHDIGSTPKHAAGIGNPILGYSGPVSDGGSVDLSTSSRFANTGIAVVRPTTAITLECWVWIQQNLTGTNLFLSWPQSPDCALYMTGSQFIFGYNSVGSNSGAIAPTHQTWTHLVGTWDGTNVKLYVNAIAFPTNPVAALPAGSFIIEIGTNQANSFFSASFLAELAIYNTALSPARVNAHFLAADRTSQPPIYSQAGGISGQIANVQYTGGTQQILADLFSHYANSP